ncbi:MAG TPA: VWA domain-containing protein, partial [Planctomycetota bacterium]|nr:VWA domain-containing protein [Planctomycetota bacterium]
PGWKAWWAANGDNFLAGRARDDSAGTETAEPPRLPTFYGFTVTSKRVVFIMDRSTSMESQTTYKPAGGKPGQDKPEGNQLFHIARFELRTVIRMLPEDTLFNVVMFSDGTRVWQPTLVPASRANREAAVAWIQATPPSGNTNTFDALETAFQIRGPSSDKRREQGADTIFLVSDGIPTVGRLIDPNMILMELGRMNRTRRVRVNTVAIGDALAGTDADFLKKMAEQNQGSFAWRK